MSPTMPTTVIHSSVGPPGPSWIRAPMAFPSGQNRRAIISLITATLGADAMSASVISRPAIMSAPMVSRKPGDAEK